MFIIKKQNNNSVASKRANKRIQYTSNIRVVTILR